MCQSSDLETEISALQYNSDGLIPAIAQQHDTGEVLMMAWMNAKSIQETLNTGRVCYWSRSRQKYWRKGEESGQIQTLKAMRFDCDNDTILLMVDQIGPACHTGRKTCFYKLVQDQTVIIDSEPLIDPKTLYGK
jgi:phosphoribosyl-AMP cyclohydrolase